MTAVRRPLAATARIARSSIRTTSKAFTTVFPWNTARRGESPVLTVIYAVYGEGDPR